MVEPGYPSPRQNPEAESADLPLSFASEASGRCRVGGESPLAPWKLLIVDDEEEVHSLTRLVLRNYEFEDRGLTLLSAYSGVGARKVLAEHPDIALILLDVVMEQEDSGLRLVQFIRGKLKNHHIRIILRTGQPGQAPEMDVVARYDINDYKAKTDLTAQKLFTTVTSSLRAWRDIKTIECGRRGLEKVVAASGGLFQWRSLDQFAQVVLKDLVGLVTPVAGDETEGRPYELVSGLVARRANNSYRISNGVGCFAGSVDRDLNEIVPGHTGPMIARAAHQDEGLFWGNNYVNCLTAEGGEELVFLLQGMQKIRGVDSNLIHLFMANVATAFRNVNLSIEIIETQKEIIQTLGEVVETRSQETANHVLRVGLMAEILAEKAGLEPEQITVLRMAAPMHDVGKVGIPDAVLNKPGKLTPDEYRVMQTHPAVGYDILAKSERPLMKAAAIVAQQHHEKWDGTGYPQGLVGTEIDIFGRITALVDVFDAMANHRVYRQAMELGEVLQIIRQGRGAHFDPDLVDVFLANLAEFVAVIRAHPDLRPQAVSVPNEDQGCA